MPKSKPQIPSVNKDISGLEHRDVSIIVYLYVLLIKNITSFIPSFYGKVKGAAYHMYFRPLIFQDECMYCSASESTVINFCMLFCDKSTTQGSLIHLST